MTMTQEDGYIEIRTNVWNRNPLTRWIRPVKIRRLKMLFDVYCWIVVGRESSLDFAQVDQMDPEEFMTWAVYGGMVSYAALQHKRPRITPEICQEYVKGILIEDRLRMTDTIIASRQTGDLAESYLKARAAKAEDQGGSGEKKAEG